LVICDDVFERLSGAELFGVAVLEAAAADIGFYAAALAAVAEWAVGRDARVAPFSGDALGAGEDFAVVDDARRRNRCP
jgi:hypothetical protein